jgi:glycosyltransferase involved in cell wall biosynthesis
VSPGRAARPPRLCFNALFLQNHLGGIGNYCYQLVKHLRALHPDWQLSLLVHAGTAPNFRTLEGVEILEVPLKSRAARLLYFHLLFPFKALRFDLLHSVGNMGMAFCPVPQVVSIMDTYEQVSPDRFSRRKRFLMARLISHSGRMARRILTISESTKRDIARFYPHLAKKTEVIYLGNKFPASLPPEGASRMHFIFVGTLEPGKNLALLLKAFARLEPAHGQRLIVVGAMGWKQSHLPELLASLRIADRVDFKGYVSDADLMDLYGRSLALVQASSYEGFGLPVIEAMACGCPVIAARNSGLVEAGGDAALFFETGDEDGLLRHMERLARDPELRKSLTAKGLAHAKGFTWEETARKTAEAYGFRSC